MFVRFFCIMFFVHWTCEKLRPIIYSGTAVRRKGVKGSAQLLSAMISDSFAIGFWTHGTCSNGLELHVSRVYFFVRQPACCIR